MPSYTEVVSKRICDRRESLGLTQRQLGDRVDYSTKQINSIENDRVGIDLALVEKLSAALECSPIDLLFPGELPKPMVKEPTPLEALDIVKKALKEKQPKQAEIPADISEALNEFDDWDVLRAALGIPSSAEDEPTDTPSGMEPPKPDRNKPKKT